MIDKSELISSVVSGIVGDDRVRTDMFDRRIYSHDLGSFPKLMDMMFNFKPDCIVKPESAEEISKIVKFAAKERIPIIPRGGASWGMSGCVPVEGGIVIDMTNMNHVLDIDGDNLIVTTEAGITWQDLYEAVEAKGYMVGSYPSSAPSATVAGWINTGGKVGIGSYKYGGGCDNIRSLEVVLPNGSIISTGSRSTLSSGSGYDLNQMFVSAEGTLGIITKATFRIFPKGEIRPLSYLFSDLKAVGRAVSDLTRSSVTPYNISFADNNHFALLRELGHGDAPDGSMLNVALEGTDETIDYEEGLVDEIMKGAKKESLEMGMHEWEERSYELRAKRLGPSAILGEAFIPVPRMDEAIDHIYALIKKMKLRAAITGMVSDQNSVIFMPYYLTDERKLIRSMMSLGFMGQLAGIGFKDGGRPSGLGVFFAYNLRKFNGGVSYGVMHDMKSTLDPYDIMNPGKLTEGLTRFGFPLPGAVMPLMMGFMPIIKGILPKDK
ncbi:MAG: FAD-binding oxidoreductase [Halobacteriota archaeon]|nr:FAD-binding oxidoreductase [Halobacteriota archaeon]